MPTDPLPGERCVVLAETLKELEEQLEAGSQIDDGMFRAIAMLIADAILAGDDQTLYEGITKLELIYHSRRRDLRSNDLVLGRLLGYVDVINYAQIRMIPRAVLEQLAPGALARQVLEELSTSPGARSSEFMVEVCGENVEFTLHKLRSLRLVSYRRPWRTTYWEITPRGKLAFRLTRP
jgi:hypothetical protein